MRGYESLLRPSSTNSFTVQLIMAKRNAWEVEDQLASRRQMSSFIQGYGHISDALPCQAAMSRLGALQEGENEAVRMREAA